MHHTHRCMCRTDWFADQLCQSQWTPGSDTIQSVQIAELLVCLKNVSYNYSCDHFVNYPVHGVPVLHPVNKELNTVPADKFPGDKLPPLCRYLCRVLAWMELLFLLHFFIRQWCDFLLTVSSAEEPHIFFRNFFSTYLDLIQASFSCLQNQMIRFRDTKRSCSNTQCLDKRRKN